jgi:hypothetical protein
MWKLIVSLMLVSATALLAADYYKLSGVRRIDRDLYKTMDGMYMETRYCYHYAYGEDALLKWEGGYSYDNKVIWNDNSNCQVKRVWR